MVSLIYTRTKFIPQLLAPLPEGEEQPNARRFMRQLSGDAKAYWRDTRRAADIAELKLEIARLERRAEGAEFTVYEGAEFTAYVAEIDRQMAIPAPDMDALRWKKNRRAVGAHRSQTERRDALIAADEARLSGGEA